ncbi:hypothetical protein MNV49_007288 [Pseudohyphozyma bogoriensis]|nr:hypothetical protein MNV49_007288 [Pseudohyphozyma bogoriensis]
MATIDSFPPELVLKVLEHSVEEVERRSYTHTQWRRQQLCLTAAVSRSWAHPSQMLLWREMEFRSDESVDLLLEGTTPQRYRTETLYLREISPEKMSTLLGHLRGIELAYVEETRLSTALLLSPSLKDLKELALANIKDLSPDPSVDVKIKLARLKLWNGIRPGGSLISLLESSRHLLTDLSLNSITPIDEFLSAWERVKPNLLLLRIECGGRWGLSPDPTLLTKFFSSCGTLEHLSICLKLLALRPLLASTARISEMTITGYYLPRAEMEHDRAIGGPCSAEKRLWGS